MTPMLDERLCAAFPAIMAERNLSATQTAMCWGFDVGDGWYDILYTAMHLVQSHIDIKNRADVTVEQVVFEQVKEKFGTLRIYSRGGDAFTDGVLSMAEAMSGCTCETCGDVGYATSSGWIKTLCKKHHEEREERMEL